MKIVTSRDIKNNPNILFDEPAETVITSRGRPKAVCITLDDDELDDIDEFLRALHQARAKRCFEKIRMLMLKGAQTEAQGPDNVDSIISEVVKNSQGRLF